MLVVSGNFLAGVAPAQPAPRPGVATPMTAPVEPPAWPRRVLRTLLAIPLAIWIFLEEWVWDHVLTFMAWLGRLPPVYWVETKIAALPAYAALIAFLIPAAILLPSAGRVLADRQRPQDARRVGVHHCQDIGTAFLARIFSADQKRPAHHRLVQCTYFAITGWKERLMPPCAHCRPTSGCAHGHTRPGKRCVPGGAKPSARRANQPVLQSARPAINCRPERAS
jgi:hypothetical protein